MPKPTRRELAALGVALPSFSLAAPAAKPSVRRLLSGAVTPAGVASALVPRAQWKPFPPAADRAAWEALPDRKDLVAAGEKQLGAPWPALPATLFLEYARNGNRSRYEARAQCPPQPARATSSSPSASRPRAGSSTRSPTASGPPARKPSGAFPRTSSAQKAGNGLPDVAEPIVDLFAAETASLLAWTDYLLGRARSTKRSPLRARAHPLRDRPPHPHALHGRAIDFWWMGLDRNGRA